MSRPRVARRGAVACVTTLVCLLPGPAHAHDPPRGAEIPYAVAQPAGPYTLTVTGSPYVGEGFVSVAATTAAGQAPIGTRVALVAIPPAGDGAPHTTDSSVPDGDGHYTMVWNPTVTGSWELQIALEGPAGSGRLETAAPLTTPPREIPTNLLVIGVLAAGFVVLSWRRRARAPAEPGGV